MNMRSLRQYLGSQWKPLALYGGLFVALGSLLYWRLGTLLPGYAQSELTTYQASLTFSQILHNPLNAPFLLIVKGLSYVLLHNLLVTRLAATLFGALTLVVFAVLVRRWHDTRTAFFATLLFGTTAWFLHTARLGTPDVLMFGVFLLVANGFWLKKTNHWLALLVCFLLIALLLYVPGMVWFVVLGGLWQWKTIDQVFKKHLAIVTVGALLVAGALVPLGWAIYNNHDVGLRLLGVPGHWPSVLAMFENLLKVPFHLFIHGGTDPVHWLGTAPLFDAFTLAMFALGSYLYMRHFRLVRTPLFILIAVITAALVAINGTVTLTVIIPFVYIVAAAGISYLLDQWFAVFPRNPIARTIGWTVIGAVVALACTYQLTHYFVGWPHASATFEAFMAQGP